ncbi:MAG: glycosyltransferase family 39 protein [Candidatus Curtissbacteria bacterium]|nr:glycosyltransferase family 39 protein [Candidatus Curtissbacteria bacterium]
MKRHFIIFALILFGIFVLRLPSLFEPFWYGDEGIFAAVGRNLNLGGTLYLTAWDNKPPMIYLTYAGIFKAFGVSMFSLRLVTLAVVLITGTVLYEVALAVLGKKRALWTMAIFGVLSSLRLIEGNLALTEIFMILPITLAMLIAVRRNFDYLSLFGAGFLFAVASLYKQVGALEAAALGLFLFLYTKSFAEFLKKGFIMAAGFAIPHALTLAYFASRGLVSDYIFAAYTYYRIYLSESPRYALLINALKIMPIVGAFFYCLWKKRRGELAISHLFLLWGAFSLLGSFFSGRTYGHYLVQATPAVSLLLASIKKPERFRTDAAIFLAVYILPIIFLTKILFVGFGAGNFFEQATYYGNFLDLTRGKKSIEAYNNYFDSNVNLIMATSDFLKTAGAYGKSVYIWGDWSWLYATADLHNPSRYVTSFHVFGVPGGKEEVIRGLTASPPAYIIKPPSSIGNFPEFEKVVEESYTPIIRIYGAQIFGRRNLE